ncbi:zinc finger, CCHC-type containing protein, partial [Tanacetum coccineum]
NPVYTYIPEHEDEYSGIDDTPNPLVRLETIRLLIALAAKKGWKIHHLDFKTAFLHGDIKLNNTLKEMGFQQCMQEKAVYKAVTNEEFIIVMIYVDNLFVTRTSLDCINEFKKRMASQFEMSDLGELTYYLGEGNPLKEIEFPGEDDSEDERDSYGNGDYDDDPYDDDMYEGHDLSHELQAICDNLDIRKSSNASNVPATKKKVGTSNVRAKTKKKVAEKSSHATQPSVNALK